jgi:Uma2 family endonuclease
MSISTLREIDYPESDGKPMAETPLHMLVAWNTIETLNDWFAPDPMVYIWGNMFLYYVKGKPRKNVSPDVMVVKGVAKDKFRDVFKTWEERTPNLIIEVTSRKTKNQDTNRKFAIYRDRLKVPEYFLFDPRGDYIKPRLQGYRLRGGDYQPIKDVDGRFPSKVLGLHLEAVGRELRFWNPASQAWLPTKDEKTNGLAAELQLADAHAQRAELEKQLAQTKAERAEAEKQLAQTNAERAEADNERLRRELELLKQQVKDQGSP